jgi:hypothetical protein
MATATPMQRMSYADRLARRKKLAREKGFPSVMKDKDGQDLPLPLPVLLSGRVYIG